LHFGLGRETGGLVNVMVLMRALFGWARESPARWRVWPLWCENTAVSEAGGDELATLTTG
jgi:hypothetical protein